MVYDAYGDKKLLERQYPSMKKFIDLRRQRSGEELLPPNEFHSFGDWLSINADTPKDVIYLAYFARSTQLTAKAAHVLGCAEDAKELDAAMMIVVPTNKSTASAKAASRSYTRPG